MLLTGTLREYPFSLLLEILLHHTETGLLEISSSKDSGYFYLKNGKVKDGRIGNSQGLAAVKVAREIDDGSFRFRRLEPADYARVVWQRRFGPTGFPNGQRGRSVPALANGLRDFRSVVVVAYHHAQTVGTFVIHQTVACATAAINRRAAIAAALQQGIDHNVIFAITVTVLMGVSGLCVYQLVQLVSGDQQSIDTGISIDQHFDTSANATPTKTTAKRSTNKRRSTRRLRDKPAGSKRGVRPPREPDAAPQKTSTGVSIAPN